MGGACSSEDNTAPAAESEKQPEPQPQPKQEPAAAPAQPAAEKKVEPEPEAASSEEPLEEEEETFLDEDDEDSDFEECYGRGDAINPKNLLNLDEIDADFGINVKSKTDLAEDDLFATEEAGEGEQFMAVKPWLGAIVAPSDAPENNPAEPDQNLELEWVYGYRGFDSRSNLVQGPQGHLIYPQAAVVVKYDPKTHTQTHFRGMTDDVICLAQSPVDKALVAMGQVATIVDRRATLPQIGVWNSETGESWILPKAHKRAVRSVTFSACGKYLASVGQDDNYTVSVWDWANKKLLASEKSGNSKVFQVKWGNAQAPNSFVTVGVRHVFHWTFENGTLSKKRGIFGKHPSQSFFAAVYTPKGMALVGAKDGSLYVFKGNKCVKRFEKVAKGAIFTIDNHGEGVVVGGKDKTVHVLDSKLKEVRAIETEGQVRSLHVASGDELVVGLKNGSVHTANAGDGVVSAALIQGHWDGELWALAVHPTNGEFTTAGEDNTVRRWSIADRKQLASSIIDEKKGGKKKVRRVGTTSGHPTNQCARGVAYSPDGQFVAVGTNRGHVKVYDAASMDVVVEHDINQFASKRKVNNQTDNWIQAMAYSPDGSVLAVGSHASVIALLDVADNHKPVGKLTAHNAAVTHLDWSKDGANIQSICRGYELLFHDINSEDLKESGHNSSPSALKDVEWATQTCMLGWPVQGVFDSQQDGTDINLCARSPDGGLLATGDDYGNVNLFRYPVLEKGVNKQKIFGGHSSHVMNVTFTPDGEHLLTAGGNDKAVFQWKVAA